MGSGGIPKFSMVPMHMADMLLSIYMYMHSSIMFKISWYISCCNINTVLSALSFDSLYNVKGNRQLVGSIGIPPTCYNFISSYKFHCELNLWILVMASFLVTNSCLTSFLTSRRASNMTSGHDFTSGHDYWYFFQYHFRSWFWYNFWLWLPVSLPVLLLVMTSSFTSGTTSGYDFRFHFRYYFWFWLPVLLLAPLLVMTSGNTSGHDFLYYLLHFHF